jgi:putative membrane protein
MYAKADHDRIHDAIEAVEQRTSGEICCIVAEESGRYREVPFAWAAALALLAPPAALITGLRPAGLAGAVQGLQNSGWVVGHVGPFQDLLLAALIGYALVQMVLFGLGLVLFSVPAVRRLATPARLKTDRVHVKAMEQFAHRMPAAPGGPQILIFASLAERRVEVIGDEAIHAKVGEAAWDQAVRAAVSQLKTGDTAGGLIAAVTVCGDLLEQHFPPDGSAHTLVNVVEI